MPLFVRKTDKNHKNEAEIAKMDPNGKSIIDKIMEDISDGSTTKQLVLGTASGLITGLISMKIGKAVAMAVGGSIILLQVANENDLVKINWNKVNKKIDKVVDNVEEKISGQGPSLMDKMERYVDRQMDKVEDKIKSQQKKAKSWYSNESKYKGTFVFVASFVVGVAIGIAAS